MYLFIVFYGHMTHYGSCRVSQLSLSRETIVMGVPGLWDVRTKSLLIPDYTLNFDSFFLDFTPGRATALPNTSCRCRWLRAQPRRPTWAENRYRCQYMVLSCNVW